MTIYSKDIAALATVSSSSERDEKSSNLLQATANRVMKLMSVVITFRPMDPSTIRSLSIKAKLRTPDPFALNSSLPAES